MTHNFRLIHYANGSYGIASVHYSGDIPQGDKKGDGKVAEHALARIISVEPNALAVAPGEGIERLKEGVKQMRDAFLRPVLEEADLPKRPEPEGDDTSPEGNGLTLCRSCHKEEHRCA